MKKAKVEGRIVDVINLEDLNKIPADCRDSLAVERDNVISPIKGKNADGPGLYPGNLFCVYRHPNQEELPRYSAEGNVIDFNDTSNIKEFIEKQDKLNEMERTTLTTDIGDIFKPPIEDSDTPETAAFKAAVIEKNIDINKYKPRFGSVSAFNNGRRGIIEQDITFNKLKYYCNIFDMKATLIIEDKNENVANPIGRQIVVDITGGDE